MLAFHNGQIIPENKISLSIVNTGFLIGDGVFTTLHLNNGAVENINKHLERLKEHCELLNIIPPFVDKQWIKDLVIANKATQQTWRMKIIVIAASSAEKGLPRRSAEHLLITLQPYEPKMQSSCKLCIYPEPVSTPLARIKTLGYLYRSYIKNFAVSKDCFDAITINCKGILLETAHANIFWIHDNTFYTPALSLPLLQGTFLSSLLQAVRQTHYSIVETQTFWKDVPWEATVFICSSLMGMQPVDMIEAQSFTRNPPLESQLRKTVQEVIASDTLVC